MTFDPSIPHWFHWSVQRQNSGILFGKGVIFLYWIYVLRFTDRSKIISKELIWLQGRKTMCLCKVFFHYKPPKQLYFTSLIWGFDDAGVLLGVQPLKGSLKSQEPPEDPKVTPKPPKSTLESH